MVFEKSPVSDAAQAEPDVEPDDAKVNEAMANLSARPGMFQRLPSGHLAISSPQQTCQADLSKASPKDLDKYLVDKAQKVIDRAQKARSVTVEPPVGVSHRDGVRLIDTADTGAW